MYVWFLLAYLSIFFNPTLNIKMVFGEKIPKMGVRLLTGMDRNAPERTGMDLHNWNGPKNQSKIHVLSVFDKKFWLSNVKYQIPSVSRQFQCQKCFLKYFLSYPDILVPYYLRLTYTSHL